MALVDTVLQLDTFTPTLDSDSGENNTKTIYEMIHME